jgi:murein DD-endopeptidase MepM/ murein hydrolase activator NlpD
LSAGSVFRSSVSGRRRGISRAALLLGGLGAIAAAGLSLGASPAAADEPVSPHDYWAGPFTATAAAADGPGPEVVRASFSLRPPAFGLVPLAYRLLNDEELGLGASPKASLPYRVHKVTEGDTSFTIAVEYGIKVQSLLVNNPHIEPGEDLTPGLEVVVPLDDGVLHTVQPAETLESIAGLYLDGSAEKIARYAANHLKAGEQPAAGSRILVPGAEPPPPPEPPAVVSNRAAPADPLAVPGLEWPAWGPISDEFASCRSEDCSVWHTGLDIDLYAHAGSHTEIYAAAEGTVVHVEELTYGYGYHVIVDHGYGMSTLYGHLSEIWVTEGDHLQQGEALGLSGSTGYSTGEHLHLEVRIDGELHDPLAYLP